MATRPEHGAFGLRRRLLWWMAVPLLAFALLDAWASYRTALATSQKAFDRLLVTAAHSLGDMIRLERGQMQVSLPHAALELYAGDVRPELRGQPGRSPLMYRVGFLNGDFLAGDASLVPYAGLPPVDTAYAARLQFYDRMVDGEPARFVALWQPVEAAEGMRYVVVQVGEFAGYRYAMGQSILWETLLRQGGLLVLLLAALWGVATAAMQPLRSLARTVAQRSPEDLHPLAVAEAPQEVQPLLQSFNGLLARVQQAQQRQQRFVADASHQLRTPLAVLQLHAESGLHGDVPAQEALHNMLATTRRTSRVVHQLLMWNRLHTDAVRQLAADEAVDLRALMQDVAVQLSPLMAQRRQDFGLDASEGAATWQGPRWMVEEILKNLLTNAMQHTPQGAGLGMRLLAQAQAGQEGWSLQVWDSGPGLAPQVQTDLFTPFMTGNGQGVGLGLAICKDLAQACGGSLQVHNTGAEGGGAGGVTARLWLPAAAG